METDWQSIVRDQGPMVFGTAWRILGHAADAEDVVQEVFLEALKFRRTKPVKNLGGLLRRLATYRSLDRLRQRRTTLPIDRLTLAAPAGGPEAEAIGRELAERLRESIAQLPVREQAVFCLRYFDNLSHREIAEILDISPGAASTALHKGRAKLETLLTGVTKGESP